MFLLEIFGDMEEKHLSKTHKERISESVKDWWKNNKDTKKVADRNQKLSKALTGNTINKHRWGKWIYCEQCKEKFFATTAAINKGRRFCSCACWIAYTREHGSPVKGMKFTTAIKRKEFLSKITCCERCGFNDKRILIVHHRDYNRRHNKRENLEALCPNCHTLDHYLKTGTLRLKSLPLKGMNLRNI